MKTGIFIGRFQPFHIGHLAYIQKLAEETDKVIIGIGSSQYSHTLENPFTADERKMMIESSIKETLDDYVIIDIPDVHNYSEWVEHVEKLCPKFDVVYSGNKILKSLFEEKGYEVITPNFSIISATQIREMVYKDQDWEKFVPPEVSYFLKTMKGVERIKRIYKEQERFPRTAVDVITELYDKNENFLGVAFIKRKYNPKGIAIPGGMQEYGESIETTAKREIKEEIGVDIVSLKPLEFRSKPDRDPRAHTNSMIFIGKAYGMPKSGSDAKAVYVLKPENVSETFKRQLAFDHSEIWESYLKRKAK